MHKMKTKKKQKRSDALLKVYYRDVSRFADMINGILFNGHNALTPTMLEDYDTDTSTYVDTRHSGIIGINRNRDIIKKVNMDGKAGLIAIENQSHIDRRMLYRIREYDSYTCLNQYYHQPSSKRKNLLHIMTLILYFGSKPWKGARTFNELALQPPTSLQTFMNYPMVPVISMIELDEHNFHHKDNYDLIRGLKLLYQFNGNIDMLKGMTVTRIVASILAVFSDDEELYEIIQIQPEEEIDVCESIRLFRENNIREGISRGRKEGISQGRKEGISQGRKEGINQGRKEGINQGRKEGKREGRIEMLLELLKDKFGYLSQETISKIQTSQEKELKELTKQILKIEDEKEVIEILIHS